jgi:hypothetical protein
VEKESPNKADYSSLRRTALFFFFGGLIFHYLVYTIHGVYQIVWYDFLHHNPHRSQAHALELLLRTPSYALLSVVFSVFPVIVATIIAMVSHRIWGCVPIYILVVLVPLCGFLFLSSIFVPNFGPDPNIIDVFWLSVREVPVWVGCWWLSNRTPKN